jgi:DNA-binding beta-propeller fold protein YncE
MFAKLVFYTVLATTSITLPGGPPVGMDYLVYDPVNHRVWAPAGNTGNVDVVDTATGQVTPIGGFTTSAAPKAGRPNLGPSSATVGDGVVWVGNRGDNRVCAFDTRTLDKRACVQLETMPDGIQYVAARRELWITTPRDHTITIVDVGEKTPTVVASIKVDGDPEGYGLDGAHGIFYTNLEDRNQTLAIDIRSRKVASVWPSGCGGAGPRGIAVAADRGLLLVACTDGVVSLDLRHRGKMVGRIKTGNGVDNIDYLAARKLVYVASREANLQVAITTVDPIGIRKLDLLMRAIEPRT